jgi:hypothetical protein
MKSEIQAFIRNAFPHSGFHDLKESNRLLDFSVPGGLSCELSKVVSGPGCAYFKLKLPKDGSLGYVYSNFQLLIGTRIDRAGTIDAIGAYSHSPTLMNILSNNYLHFQTLYSINPAWTVSAIYSKEPGFNTLYTFKGLSPWTAKIGGEVFYSPSERAGGMSLGGSLSCNQGPREEFVAIVNPIMGDTTISYYIGLGDKMEASTKYMFNRFSLESDLSLGVLFKSIQVRLDSRGLLRLKWELPLKNIKFIFGIESELLPINSQVGKSAFGLTLEL